MLIVCGTFNYLIKQSSQPQAEDRYGLWQLSMISGELPSGVRCVGHILTNISLKMEVRIFKNQEEQLLLTYNTLNPWLRQHLKVLSKVLNHKAKRATQATGTHFNCKLIACPTQTNIPDNLDRSSRVCTKHLLVSAYLESFLITELKSRTERK